MIINKHDKVYFIAQKILENKERLAKEIVQLRMKSISDSKNDFLEEESLLERSEAFLELVGRNMISPDELSLDNVVDYGSEKGKEAVVRDVPISHALQNSTFYRKVIWGFLGEIVEQERLDGNDIITIADKLDPILDQAMYGYSKSYVEYNIEISKRYQETLLELSVPVVPLFTGVAVLPFIGDLDTNRAKLIQDKTIQRCQDLNLERLIIDLSGVPVVDTMVAHHIFQLVTTLRILGIKTLITGIRSAVAITAVNLGIDLHNLNIYRSLQQALDALGYGLVHEETIK